MEDANDDTEQEHEFEQEEVDDEINTNSDGGFRMRFDGNPVSLIEALEALSGGGGLPQALRGTLGKGDLFNLEIDVESSPLCHIGLLGQMQMAGDGEDGSPAGGGMLPFAQLLEPGNSRFQRLLEGINTSAPAEKQMACLSELSTKMAMSSEEVLLISGFNPEAFAAAIVEIICTPSNMEVLLVAARCLANLLEMFPRRAIPRAVSSGIVPALCQKLLEIEYMDVAEISFRILARISSWKPPSSSSQSTASTTTTTVAANRKAIIQENGFIALLQFIDFFPIAIQRTAAQISSQLCINFPMECFHFLENGMPFILNLLQSSDSELLHHACEAFKNLAESKSFTDTIPGLANVSLSSQIVSEDLCKTLLNHLQMGIEGEKKILSNTLMTTVRFFACLLSSPSGKRTILWQELPRVVLNLLSKQDHPNTGTSAVLDGPLLKEILRLVVVLLTTNEAEEDLQHTDPEMLNFVSKLIPLVIRVFDTTVRSDLRAGCLGVIYRGMSILLLSKQLPQETDLPGFLSRVLRPCKSKNDYLEVHLALQIVEQLFKAQNQKYIELLERYGVYHALRLYEKHQGSSGGIDDTYDIASVAAKLVKEFLHDEEKNTDLDLLVAQLNSKDPLQVESGLKTLAEKSTELTAHEVSTSGLISALIVVLSDFDGCFSKIFGNKSNRQNLTSFIHNIHEAIAAEKSEFVLFEEEEAFASSRSVSKELGLLCQHMKIKVKARDDSNVQSDEIKGKIQGIQDAVVLVEALARVETVGTFISKKLWGKNNDLMSLFQGQGYDEDDEDEEESENEDNEEEEEVRASSDETELQKQENLDSDSTKKSNRQKYHIQLFYKDHLLSSDMSILEAIWKLYSKKKKSSIWNKKEPHVLEFRVIEGVKPIEESPKQINSTSVEKASEATSSSWGEDAWKMLSLLDLMQKELKTRQATNERYQTIFVNEFLCVQMIRVLQQPLQLVTHSLPQWCEKLTNQYPFALSFHTRQHYLYARAGTPRAIQYMCRTLWKDAITLEQESGFSVDNEEDTNATARRRHPVTAEDVRATLSNMERMAKIPRLKVRVARAKLLPSAMKLFHSYGGQKAMIEIEFLGEVGTGSGPTTEFYTLLCQQIQSKHLNLWKDEDRSPSSEQDSSTLGKSEKATEKSDALKKKQEEEETSSVVPGYHRLAVYHCNKCFHVEIPTCSEHHQLLTRDVKSKSEEEEEPEGKKKSKSTSKDKYMSTFKAFCAACTISEETSNMKCPAVVCKGCSKEKEEESEEQVKMSLKWWVLSDEEVAYLDKMYPYGESSIFHPVLQCSHCETVSFPGTEAGLVMIKGPWMISKGGQRMTERDYRAVSKHVVSLCEGTPLKQTKCLLRPDQVKLLAAGIKTSPEVRESQIEAFGYIKESNMASRMMLSDPVKAPHGLMPLPLTPTTAEKDTTETRASFNFLGRLMAQALLDQRLLNIPLSRTFLRAIRGEKLVHENVEVSLTYVMEMDPTVGRSLSYLIDLHVSYTAATNDKQTFESELNDMCLYFTLVGYPSIELIPNGKEIQVTMENVALFLSKTLEFLLDSSFSIQLKAFEKGFNAIWDIDVLKLYDVDELEVLFADSSSILWDIEGKALRANMICDHGFTKESQTIHDLIDVLCEMRPEEQRLFVGFVTGANRLPVGGLAKLDPKLTVVRKLASDADTMDDEMLPSASTCTNYLKLPAYSSKKVLKERLLYCIHEGQYAFHLS